MNLNFSTNKLPGFLTREWVILKYLMNYHDPEIVQVLEKHFDFYNRLLPYQQREYNRKVFIFIKCKKFIGMNGFEIVKFHKIVISAIAIRLIFIIGLKFFDHINKIYVFESEFDTTEFSQPLDGITNNSGIIGFSWQAIKEGIENGSDGTCVGIHEFAHALDLYDGNFDGLPLIFKPKIIKPLIEQIYKEHENICINWVNWVGIIQRYKVRDISEFFAVMTEIYFEKPEFLKKNSNGLYTLMKTIYKYEPAAQNIHQTLNTG